MELVGYIDYSESSGFCIPVYGENDQFYSHDLNKYFTILDFIRCEVNRLVKLDSPLKVEKNEFGFCVLKVDGEIFIKRFNENLSELEELLNSKPYYHNLKLELYDLMSHFPRKASVSKRKVGRKRRRIVFDAEQLWYSCDLMRALAHPLRLKILEFIDVNEKINVNHIYDRLGIEQSVTSQHLRVMKLAGVLNAEKDGKYMKYSINYDVVLRAKIGVDVFIGKELDEESKRLYLKNREEIMERKRKKEMERGEYYDGYFNNSSSNNDSKNFRNRN